MPEICNELLAVNDIAAFKWIKNDTFRILCNLPDWFYELFPDFDMETEELILSEHFQYLDYFVTQAMKTWDADQDGKLTSDI